MSRVIRYESSWRTTVGVGVTKGFSLAIKENTLMSSPSDLVLMDDSNGECFPLGKATKRNIESIQNYLEQLKGFCE